MRKLTRFFAVGALVAFASVAVTLYWAEPAAAQRIEITRAELSPAIAVQERHNKSLLSRPDVVGTAVGADNAGRPIIKVYVTREGVAGIPARVDGVTVVRQVTGPIVALQRGTQPPPEDPTQRFDRPVPIGVSTGHPDITAGTIGCRVTDGSNVWALSNNHVLADENSASIGDDVIQPGAFDGGSSPADTIGTLYDFEPIVFSQNANNVIDAAIASTTTALLGNSTPSDGYGTPESTTVDAALRQRVMKYGRTTSQTRGRVVGINATILVLYDTGVARFVNQIEIRGGGFSAGGDSGSLILVERGQEFRKAVGLLFAGGGGSTFANPIDEVLTTFGVTIDGN